MLCRGNSHGAERHSDALDTQLLPRTQSAVVGVASATQGCYLKCATRRTPSLQCEMGPYTCPHFLGHLISSGFWEATRSTGNVRMASAGSRALPEAVQILSLIAVFGGAFAGIGHAIAAIVREIYRGKALLIFARRGDPQAVDLFMPTRIISKIPRISRGKRRLRDLGTNPTIECDT